jgi:hypothetical protein
MTTKKNRKIEPYEINDIPFASFLLYQGYGMGGMRYRIAQKDPVYFLFYNKDDNKYISLVDVKINQMLFKKNDAVEFFDRYADCMKFIVSNALSLTENEARKRKEYRNLQRHFDNKPII